jgi:YHS domain-containing protein
MLTPVPPDRDLDPLCGAVVDRAQAEAAGLRERHNDVEYLFCGVSCLVAFEVDPGRALGLDDGWTPTRLRAAARRDIGVPAWTAPGARRRDARDGDGSSAVGARGSGASRV